MARAANPSSSGTGLELLRERQYTGCIVASVVGDEEAKRAIQAVLRDDTSNIVGYVSACVPALLPRQTQQYARRLAVSINEVSYNTKQRNTSADCPQVER